MKSQSFESPDSQSAGEPERSAGLWCWGLPVGLCLAVAVAAISNESFWIDEGATGLLAHQSTLSSWWQEPVKAGVMPFYMLYTWLWDKVFGHGEWCLRMANLPWFVLGMLAIPRRHMTFLVVIALSPFVWFYLNEARPYAMQIGLSLTLLGTLWRLGTQAREQSGQSDGETGWVALFCLALLALGGTSMLGMFWVGGAVASAPFVLGWPRFLQVARRHWVQVFGAAAGLMGLAVFYWWCLRHSASATPGSTALTSTLFAGYELVGLAGLGPSRAQLRAVGPSAVLPFLPVLAVHATVTLWVFLAGCRRAMRQAPRRILLGAVLAMGGTTALLLAAGATTHVRVLGRHCAPLVASILLLMALGVSSLWERGGVRRLVAVLFLVLSLASSLSLRLADRHARDDYRQAAAIARAGAATGERVWWCADGGAGLCYEVPLSRKNSAAAAGEVWLVKDPDEEFLKSQPPPRLVILSKPDLHDGRGAVRKFVTDGRYQAWRTFPAFVVWRREAD